MTLASTLVQTSGATGSGTTGPFSFSFRVQSYGSVTVADQLQVIKVTISTGAEEILTVTTDYTISVNNDQDASPGGSVTLVSPLSSAYKLYIRRNPSYVQSTNLANQSAYFASTVETQFDQVGMQLQDMLDRMKGAPYLGVQKGSSFDGKIADSPVGKAGYSVVVKTDETGFSLGQPAEAPVSAAMAPVVAAASLGVGLNTLLGARKAVANNAALTALTAATGLESGATYVTLGRTSAGDGGHGVWRYVASDQSATLVKATKTVTAVDTTRDYLYSASHGFLTNDVVIATAADAGLSLDTLYYVRCREETAALAIGSTPANVATGAFLYDIGGTIYSKSAVAAGTAPGNDVVPQGKWGCVAFEIGADGTIDAVEAADNATGYASKALARAGLPAVQASHIRIGDVCVTKSDSTFTFGTTALNAANVTAIFTQAPPRNFLPNWFSLHASYADATSDANKINITSLTSLQLKKLLDPQQGVYAIPDGASRTGSAGCFIRQLDGPINPSWFSTSSPSDALQAAAGFGLARSDFAHVRYADVGNVTLDRQVSIWLPKVAPGPSNTTTLSTLRISGAGRGVTRLRRASGSALRFVYGGQQNAVELVDFSMVTGSAGGGSQAVILENHDPYGFFGEFTARNRISADFHGDDGIHLTNYWSTAVECIDVSNVDFSGSMFGGASTPAGQGIITRARYDDFVTVFEMSGCAFRFLSVGYEYGSGSQSAFLAHAFFAQNVTDVLATSGGTDHQGLMISGCECYKGASGNGVEIKCNVPNFVFTNNRWGVHASKSAVVMDVTNMTTITDNQFFPDLTANTATSAIDIAGTVTGSHCIIDNNAFASTTVGARLLSTATNVLFGPGNKATSGMTLVSDAGSGNTVWSDPVPLARGGSGKALTASNGGIVYTDSDSMEVLAGTATAGQVLVSGANAAPSWASQITLAGLIRSSHATAGIGYATGAGGTVTQGSGSGKSTAVTIDKVCGRITTDNATLNANTWVTFTVNNSTVASTDVVLVMSANGNYLAKASNTSAGSFAIDLLNRTGGNLSDAVPINFAVIKGVFS